MMVILITFLLTLTACVMRNSVEVSGGLFDSELSNDN